jgi:protein-L-isoaspartate(D-aspartate) O-methyltransferase
MTELSARRRFYAEEIEAVAGLRSPVLVEALASVPRERYLPPGPWIIRAEGDVQAPPRQTPDADPQRVYHNLAVAIDPARQLFNGAPGLIAMAIDALDVQPGDRVLHLGTGLGYYTAILAACVGPTGQVLGLEADVDLAAAARTNVVDAPQVEVRHGNGRETIAGPLDVIFINAGVTHPLEHWLDALAPGGRLLLPLTATTPAMGPIGKGVLVLITRGNAPLILAARILTLIAIYSAVGLRDDAADAAVGQALAKGPFAPVRTLRRDAHAPGPACWLHGQAFCLSL